MNFNDHTLNSILSQSRFHEDLFRSSPYADSMRQISSAHKAIQRATEGASSFWPSTEALANIHDQILGRDRVSQIMGTWALGGHGMDIARALESSKLKFPIDHGYLSQIAKSLRVPVIDFLPLTSFTDQYRTLLSDVHTIVAHTNDFDLVTHLGNRFRAVDFFRIHRVDDLRRYLHRTELGETFVEAPQPLVGRSLRDLHLASPLPTRLVQNASPKRFSANVMRRDGASLRALLEEFEHALRRRIAQVMTQLHGPDWARQLGSKAVEGWANRLAKKAAAGKIPEFTAQDVLEIAQFSELLQFAFRSPECAPHVVVVRWFSEATIDIEIDLAVQARNAVFHGYSRVNPSQIAVAISTIIRLAGIADILLEKVFADE